MKTILALLAFVVLAPNTFDTLAFGPKEGAKLAKRFEQHVELEKQSMTMSMGGRELPAELLEDAVFDLEFHTKVEVEDEYEKVGDGRPLVLSRAYSSLSESETEKIHMPGMPEAQETKKEKSTALEGQTVLFNWDDEKDEYAKTWSGEGADDELLKKLEEDMDLRALLPKKSLAKGDTWKIDLREFQDLFGPGGRFGFKEDGEEDDDDDSGFEDNLTGEVTCTYEGESEVDGRKLARVALACEAQTFMTPGKDDEPVGKMTFAFDLEGSALWDVEGKHLSSYELGGNVTTKIEMTQVIDGGGQKHELEIQIELGGEFKVTGEVKRQ